MLIRKYLLITFKLNHIIYLNHNITLQEPSLRIPHFPSVKDVSDPPPHYVVAFKTTLLVVSHEYLFINFRLGKIEITYMTP